MNGEHRMRDFLFASGVLVAAALHPRVAAAEEGAGVTTAAAAPRQWNPLAAGPQLLSSPGLLPAGEMFVRTYGFSEFGYAQYGGAWSFSTQALDQKLVAVTPQIEFAYGLLPSLELGAYA